MRKIVAIGGGEIGRPGYPIETTFIDHEIIKLTGKQSPKLIFIPTASGDSEAYFDGVKKYFGDQLGCQTNVLYLLNKEISHEEIEELVFASDIIYVGGGNTQAMMDAWRKTGLDKILLQAYNRGIVLSGLSAGAICWFKWGGSDSNKSADQSAGLTKIAGLGLVDALFCPHYDVEKDRKEDLKQMMKQSSGVAIAADNCCAIEIIDNQFRIISSKPMANAYKVYWQNNEYHEELLEKTETYKTLPG